MPDGSRVGKPVADSESIDELGFWRNRTGRPAAGFIMVSDADIPGEIRTFRRYRLMAGRESPGTVGYP